MNRPFLLEVVLGVTLAVFLAAALASTATGRGAPWPRRGLVVSALVYAVLLVPLAFDAGVTLPILLGVLVLLLLPLVGSVLAGRVALRRPTPQHPAVTSVRAGVAVGLLTIVLTSVGQGLGLASRLDPRVLVLAVALTGAVVAIVNGVLGVSRVGTWAAAVFPVGLALVIAVAVLVGSPQYLLEPTVEVPGPGVGEWFAWAVAMVVLGWADPALRRTNTGLPLAALRAGVGLLLVTGVFGLALLVFLGGSAQGPSLALFTLPANLDVVPGPMLLLATGSLLLAIAMAASSLWAVGSRAPVEHPAAPSRASAPTDGSGPTAALGDLDPLRPARSRVVVVIALASVLALVGVGVAPVAAVTGLTAAAVVGCELAQTPPRRAVAGLVAGLASALVAAVLLLALDELRLGLAWAVATLVVGAIAAATCLAVARRDVPSHVVVDVAP